MARYMIESPHKPEECLKALDEELEKGTDVLGRFDYGCKAGDHTAYAIVDAKTKDDALKLVPTFLQSSARIVEVGKITPDMIRSFHTKAA
jgi:hypothetical protein